ncbi:MAG: DUF86 domain-containing protein, partial [Thermoproteota archaeon]
MSEDEERLKDMLTTAKYIKEFTEEITFQEFKDSELVTAAVEREIEIMGEAAKNVSQKIKTQYPKMEWKGIAGMRDIVAHAYRKIRREELWNTVQRDIPPLINRLKHILQELKTH